MQAFLGTLIFVVVCLVSLVIAIKKSSPWDNPFSKFVSVAGWWAGCVAAFYAAATLMAGVFWVVLWIGIFLRYIALWIVGTVLYPWTWFF